MSASSQSVPAGRNDGDIAARITSLTERVFARLGRWARMALALTGGLALVAWLAAVVAFRQSSWWGLVPAVLLLVVLGIPAFAAWVLGRRAQAVHAGVASIETEIIQALRHPDLGDGLRSFLSDDGDDDDDGKAGVVRLAKGALGIRQVVKGHRETLSNLAGAVGSMAGTPLILAVITLGLGALCLAAVLFLVLAVF